MKSPRLRLKKKERAKKILLLLIGIISVFWVYFLSQSVETFYSKKEIIPSPLVNIEEEIVRELKGREIRAETTEIKPDVIILKLENNVEVILGKDKSPAEQIKTLQLILDKNKMEERRIKKIDLRSKNPVITF
ncbi:cell division protein FtsQ [Candidatus Shapirobacteria bacterium]|nr:cell division protein FtsQ [Candidatus Shapirobacteria bacterium]